MMLAHFYQQHTGSSRSLQATCSYESKCYKCGEYHEYNRDCANAVKYANYNGTRREKTREANQESSPSYSSSSARLYSTVLQTMAPHVHANAKARKMTPDRQTGQINQSTVIINTLKEEIGRSQDVLLH